MRLLPTPKRYVNKDDHTPQWLSSVGSSIIIKARSRRQSDGLSLKRKPSDPNQIRPTLYPLTRLQAQPSTRSFQSCRLCGSSALSAWRINPYRNHAPSSGTQSAMTAPPRFLLSSKTPSRTRSTSRRDGDPPRSPSSPSRTCSQRSSVLPTARRSRSSTHLFRSVCTVNTRSPSTRRLTSATLSWV